MATLAEASDTTGLRLNERRLKPTASELKRFSQSLETLTRFSPESIDSRIRALDELEALADRFSDLSYREAQIVATYLFSATDPEEELNIQRRIKSFRHWLTLGLAITDGLGMDQPLNERGAILVRLFFQIDCQANDANLHGQLIATLADQMELQRNQVSPNWSQLDLKLKTCFDERIKILGKSVANDPTSSSLEVLLAAISNSSELKSGPSQDLLRRPQRLQSFLIQSDLSAMEQTVLATNLWREMHQQAYKINVENGFENSTTESSELRNPLVMRIGELEKKWSTPNVGQALFLTELRWLSLAISQSGGTADLVAKPVAADGADQ